MHWMEGAAMQGMKLEDPSCVNLTMAALSAVLSDIVRTPR